MAHLVVRRAPSDTSLRPGDVFPLTEEKTVIGRGLGSEGTEELAKKSRETVKGKSSWLGRPVDRLLQRVVDRLLRAEEGTPFEKREGYIALPHHLINLRHAMITRTDVGYVVQDLRSRHGCFVNDDRCPHDTARLLAAGDKIQICDFVMIFRSGGSTLRVTASDSV